MLVKEILVWLVIHMWEVEIAKCPAVCEQKVLRPTSAEGGQRLYLDIYICS